MASIPPLPIAPEQRLLAVIVFTDVVGFSARMQADESATLRLLERDVTAMRELAKLLSGTVLKSTGDGLLLYFTSAVHAVEWALRTQRRFAERAKTEPPAEALRHRVGIHLGDVFVRADDVMGDGVNIAARLQAEAPTGGICISQVVYDVVKSKMTLHVVRLEARRLKNIKESIPMYHVLLEAPPQVLPTVVPLSDQRPERNAPVATHAEPKPGSKLGAMALLLAMAAGGALMVWAYFNQEDELAKSQATRAALDAALLAESNGAAANQGAAPAAATSAGSGSPSATAADEFDFALLRRSGTAADEPALRKAHANLSALNAWLETSLARYHKDRPLEVPPLRSGVTQNWMVFTGPDRLLSFAQGGAIRKRAWEDLKPDEQGAIVMSALLDSLPPPPPEVVRGAEAFAYIHGLPEMAAALLRERRAGGHLAR